MDTELICPNCKDDSRVYSYEDGATVCGQCGARLVDGKWIMRCQTCGKEVSELFGLFVPHLCKSCANAEVARDRELGRICGLCGQPRSLCCC